MAPANSISGWARWERYTARGGGVSAGPGLSRTGSRVSGTGPTWCLFGEALSGKLFLARVLRLWAPLEFAHPPLCLCKWRTVLSALLASFTLVIVPALLVGERFAHARQMLTSYISTTGCDGFGPTLEFQSELGVWLSAVVYAWWEKSSVWSSMMLSKSKAIQYGAAQRGVIPGVPPPI